MSRAQSSICSLLAGCLCGLLLAGCGSSQPPQQQTSTAAPLDQLYIPAVPRRAKPAAVAPRHVLVARLEAVCRARDDRIRALLAQPLPASESGLLALYRPTEAAYAAETRALRLAAGTSQREFADYLRARSEISALLAEISTTRDRVQLHVSIGELEQRAQSAKALSLKAGLAACARD